MLKITRESEKKMKCEEGADGVRYQNSIGGRTKEREVESSPEKSIK
jgi:hypothetical protein